MGHTGGDHLNSPWFRFLVYTVPVMSQGYMEEQVLVVVRFLPVNGPDLSASHPNRSLFWYWHMVYHHKIATYLEEFGRRYISPLIDNSHSSSL